MYILIKGILKQVWLKSKQVSVKINPFSHVLETISLWKVLCVSHGQVTTLLFEHLITFNGTIKGEV